LPETLLKLALTTGRWAYGLGKEVVGWTTSMIFISSAGTEYCIARIDCVPVTEWVKNVKVVSKSSFALEIGIERESQSPAGEMVLAEESKECKSSHS
jgi:hypothetical protein